MKMITRRKRHDIESSPKYTIGKNLHLLTNQNISETVNVLNTPTRPERYTTTSPSINNLADDSPILSQEYSRVTWKWGESTPIRAKPKPSKYRPSARNANTSSGLSPTQAIEPERQSPKGLYKFQEEMRKIQLEESLEQNCDTVNDMNVSMTEDTGYPHQTNNKQINTNEDSDNIRNANNNNSMSIGTQTIPIQTAECNDSFTKELLNDSDFDQMLLTCSERIEDAVGLALSQQQHHQQPQQRQQQANDAITTQPTSSSSTSSSATAPTVTDIAKSSSSTTSSELNLLNDESIDDLLCNVDVDFPFGNDSMNNSKFMRHRSMPQEQQKATFSIAPRCDQPSIQPSRQFQMNANRKSFARHESMPANTVNRNQANANSQPGTPPTGTLHKCTSEEIAEKRRQAIERLKKRNQQKNTTRKQ